MDSGEIGIRKFELEHFGDKTDLTPFVVEMHIFESIYDPFIQATMSIIDGAGLIDRISWAGSTVTITYTSNENVEPTTMVFIVDGAAGATPSMGDKNQTYLVRLYSQEIPRGLAITTGEIFNKMAPEKMIKQILTDKIKTKKPFTADKTGSLDTINCANLRPFQAIDKIKRRAVSRNKISSSFLFFENKHGYNFKSLEMLLSDARKNPQVKDGDRNFYLDSIQHINVENSSWRQILSFERTKSQGLMETIGQGGVSGKIYAYDVGTGKHYEFKYEDKKNSSEFDINPESITYKRVTIDDIMNKGDDPANMIVAPITSTDDLERIRKEIYVRAFMSKLAANIVRMQIHGDSRLTVGTPVTLNLPIIDGTTTKKTNKIGGGIYLISKLRHMITPSNQSYEQSCELIRTGMLE